jgi:predicted DNA-binding protein (MmcQ/YjbR family)
MYCVTGLETDSFTLSFKVKDDEFEGLCAEQAFVPAPYVARYKWVLLEKPELLTDQEIKHYVEQSYSLIRNALPLKLKKQAGLL